MKFWLFKSEPEDYSIDDFQRDKTTVWNGIRNYQARNIIRDQIKKADQFFFYHSSCKHVGIVGVGEVVSESYPDPDQFDKTSKYYDLKAQVDKPRWYCMDVKFIEKFSAAVLLKQIKEDINLNKMVLVNQGRLSVQPVASKEWEIIKKLAEL